MSGGSLRVRVGDTYMRIGRKRRSLQRDWSERLILDIGREDTKRLEESKLFAKRYEQSEILVNRREKSKTNRIFLKI